ncbi:MAG: IPT/TIG domain-containing protein [Spirochaetales bacterium]|nr:IPT/TIG domain-containing protein [Spirochaetales bacterium]
MENKKNIKDYLKWFLDIKNILPIAIFVVLLIILLFSSGFTGRAPVIESISKKVCVPNEELVIYGKFFGKSRNSGKVNVSGYSPPTYTYREWTDEKISLVVPEEMKSGLIEVITANGKSGEIIPFVNKKHMPKIAQGPMKAGEPYVEDIKPKKGPVGTQVTITGVNFGLNKINSEVYFTWIPQGETSNVTTFIPANNYDFDVWNDKEIKLRIPDGVASGSLFITTDKGRSNALYFEVSEPVGKKLYHSRLTYQVFYSVKVRIINSLLQSGLYLWIPRIFNAPEQREVKLIFQEPDPVLENYNGVMQYLFENLESEAKFQVRLSFMFKRYAVETQINPYAVDPVYNKNSNIYKQFAFSDALIPSYDTRITGLAKAVVGGERNPYLACRSIYNYLLRKFEFSPNAKNSAFNLMEAVQNNEVPGDSYIYAVSFCTLARSIGIPCRPVSGYIVDNDRLSHLHYWAEFYLEDFGWVPVDPALGDGAKYGNFPDESNTTFNYFGNLDNNHIAFSKGLTKINQINPEGKTVRSIKSGGLQIINEESFGNLFSYSIEWTPLEILGIY